MLNNLEEFRKKEERLTIEKMIKAKKENPGCDWFKDKCLGGLVRAPDPVYGDEPRIDSEELGAVFIKADVGTSFGSGFILSCCRYYYPSTERVIDWGTGYCLWEGVQGDCAPERAVMAPLGEETLFCRMDPKSPLANTLIRKCMRNATVYCWCCSK